MRVSSVIEVRPLSFPQIWLRFDDGVEGVVDLSALVLLDGVFEPLKNADFFARVRVDDEIGTIAWLNGADVDPLVLHSAVTGKPLRF